MQQRPRPQGQSRSQAQNQRVSFHDTQFNDSGNFVDDNENDGNGEEQNNQDLGGNEHIQCTMTQVSDNSQLPEAPNSKDTIIINAIKAIKQPDKCSQLNPFDVRHFMSDPPPTDSVTHAHAKENALYDPVTTRQIEVASSLTRKPKSRFPRFFKKKTVSAINNTVITILAFISLLQRPHVVSASVREANRNTILECHPIMFYSSVDSPITYNVSRNSHREKHACNSMVDGGAKYGGIGGGKNTCKVCETGPFVDMTGVDNHELNNLPIPWQEW